MNNPKLEQTFDEYNLGQKLNILPLEIWKKQKSLFEQSERLEELNLKLKLIKNATLEDVNKEVDPEGKKVFSNETARKVEADKRLGVNPSYVEAMEELVKLERTNKIGVLELEYMKRLFRACNSLARISE